MGQSNLAVVRNSHSSPSCLDSLIESKWAGVAAVVCGIAAFVIAILAINGHFCGIGVTNSLYLSYVMFGIGSLFFITFFIKSLLHTRPTADLSGGAWIE